PYGHEEQHIGEDTNHLQASDTQPGLGGPRMLAHGREIRVEGLSQVWPASIPKPDRSAADDDRSDERECMQPDRLSEVDGQGPHRLPPIPEPGATLLELLSEITNKRLESRAATDSL